MTVALITGAAGQDGFYLGELLRGHGYEVVGLVRGDADLLDSDALAALLREVGPEEIYNLASPSFVPRSWEKPVETAEFAAVGVTALLEAVRAVDPSIRVYQASSSEIFGEPVESPQTEETPLSPLTPYGVAKAYGHFIARSYRRRYGLHVSCGILYNHESPRRPLDFVPSKIADGAARASLGSAESLALGDLDAQRDWGFAGDYVEAMRLMLRQDEPGDYVIASGVLHTVRELAELAYAHVGLDWRDHVTHDPALARGEAELHRLCGDATKARSVLGWEPRVGFEELVRMLVDAAVVRLTTP
ncbi:MAG TPA: GDP-mannose 4,6-dehydratase [Gaiellaceae bacterium]|nr:GDP-mannose 4,6-dehydratase [Gaiellaceae bacterium]